MLSLAEKYTPVLSTPFGREGYRELPPCDALKPYIRCFWTERQAAKRVLVIPDTCMDIFFTLGKHDKNGTGSFFCSLDEHSFYPDNTGEELFGVRFYAWTAALFSRHNFTGSSGKVFFTEEYFDKAAELNSLIASANSFEERAAAAETWLLPHLENIRVNNDLLNAVDFIIDSRGCAKISDICCHTAVSPRKIERIFARTMGVSPKTFSSLVRYQLLWRDMALNRGFNVLDAVEKYGYSDQSHLLNDFRKRHLMNPKQALEYAKNSP